MFSEKPVCVANDSPMKPVFETIWPQLRMTLDYGESEIMDELAVGSNGGHGCDGALVARDLVGKISASHSARRPHLSAPG